MRRMSQLRDQNGKILLNVCISTLEVCEFALLVKNKSVDKATIVANDATLFVAILISSLGFYLGQSG